MMAVVGDRFTEFICEGTLGFLIVGIAIYGLLLLFRREQSDDRQDKPPTRW